MWGDRFGPVAPVGTGLRDYQEQAVADVTAALRDSKSALLVMPTASGKTVTAAQLARDHSAHGVTWFVCHRQEIMSQTSATFAAAGIPHGLVSPRHPATSAPVQICSVDTLRHRHGRLRAPDFVIWDEAHHIAAKSWAALMGLFDEAKHVGLTATPERLDGKGLGAHFECLVRGPSIRALMDAGWLSPYRMFAPSRPDLSAIGTRAGDYKAGELDAVMNRPALIGDAVEHYKRLAPGSRALVFATSVDASRAIAARFVAEGVPARHVDGTTPNDQREAAVRDLAAGRVNVLTNVEVFTEGFDVPAVDTIILLRPTRSLSLYLQMVGRGLRPAQGKREAVILDHAGLVHEHGLPDYEWSWSLDGGARRARLVEAQERGAVFRRCPSCSTAHEIAAACPTCGFVYPTGRDVEQHEGRLEEVGALEGHESRKAFAKRVGVSQTAIARAASRGLPCAPNGWVHIADGLTWWEANVRVDIYPPVGVDDPAAYESRAAFAKRAGVGQTAIARAASRGLPCAPNGWVHIADGLTWWEANFKSYLRPPVGVDDPSAYETRSAFAKRVGVSQTAIARAASRGLPCAPNGWVHIADGLTWWEANFKSYLRPPVGVDDPSAYETRSAFAKRAGASCRSIANFASRGLPCAPNGWVHIADGLAWLRNNRPTIYERYLKSQGGDQ